MLRKNKNDFQIQVQIEKYFDDIDKCIFDPSKEMVILIEYEGILSIKLKLIYQIY